MNRLFLFSLLCFGQFSFAMSGKLPPTNDHSGREQCAFYDSGKTEEHSPHQSFGDCKNHHPNCEERCFVFYQTCTAEGISSEVERIGDKLVRKEVVKTYKGSDRDSYRARDMALRSCERDYPRNEYCRLQGCSEDYDRTR